MNSGPHDIALKLAFYGNSIPQVKRRGGFIIVITRGRLLAKTKKTKTMLAWLKNISALFQFKAVNRL